ncbi:MAG: hypothetical protein K1X44_01455 [Alphaproteobacteria bacterium]|nr:hypothetical protein [Alphaproteobacteria bacterium]
MRFVLIIIFVLLIISLYMFYIHKTKNIDSSGTYQKQRKKSNYVFWLILSGLLIMGFIISGTIYLSSQQSTPQSHYHPAYIKNGKIIDGDFEN